VTAPDETAEIVVGARPVTLRRAALAEILPLRHRELRPGLPVAAAAFEGDDATATRHFGAFLAETGENVGCLSLMAAPWRGEAALQLRGMATRADLARRGIGSALLRFVEADVRATGGPRLLWCNARLAAVPFYEGLGWTVASPRFDIPSVGPHHVMVRRC
jgi:GNAT superfamily N-acetyltransferase